MMLSAHPAISSPFVSQSRGEDTPPGDPKSPPIAAGTAANRPTQGIRQTNDEICPEIKEAMLMCRVCDDVLRELLPHHPSDNMYLPRGQPFFSEAAAGKSAGDESAGAALIFLAFFNGRGYNTRVSVR